MRPYSPLAGAQQIDSRNLVKCLHPSAVIRRTGTVFECNEVFNTVDGVTSFSSKDEPVNSTDRVWYTPYDVIEKTLGQMSADSDGVLLRWWLKPCRLGQRENPAHG